MATSVNELLDMLFEMIDEAKNAPLSSEKCVIERNKSLDLIEEIKDKQVIMTTCEIRDEAYGGANIIRVKDGRIEGSDE